MASIVAFFSLLVFLTFSGGMAKFTVLMYTDSRFEDYVGQARFDSMDRCYPLCTDSEAVAAFVWDAETHGTQLVVFEDFECRGRSVVGDKSTNAELSAIASNHKVKSFLLTTTTSLAPTRGIVHSCEEKSDLIYKPYNDTAAWM